jgi:hypothetical protein
MKIYIGVCLSKSNYKFLHKFLNSITKLYKFNNYNTKYVFIVEKKNFKFKDLIIKLLKSDDYEFIWHNNSNIPQSRNLFLKFIRKRKSMYSGFLDDDCTINKNWLVNMIKFIKHSKSDILGGEQNHEAKNNFYKKLFNLLEPNYKHGQRVKWIATNNAFFKSRVIKCTSLVFDNYLKKIGGSDQLFFKELVKLDFVCKWNSLSKVKESRHINREKIKWFLKRNFRYGYSGNYIDKKIYGSTKGILISIFKILYQLIISLLSTALFFNSKYFFNSIFLISRLLGRIFAISGYKFKKYI